MGASDDRSGGGNKVFATITADGRLKVMNNADEGAIMRPPYNKAAEEYKYFDTQKVEHSQWAFIFTSYTGYIKDIRQHEVELPTGNIMVLEIEFEDDGEVWQISTQNKGNFAYDFLEKAINIDFSKPVKFAPWSWDKDKNGKLKKGVTLIQGKDEEGKPIKIQSPFWEDQKRTEAWPSVSEEDAADYDKEDWRAFYAGPVRKFLYKHLAEKVLPKLKEESKDMLDNIPEADVVAANTIPTGPEVDTPDDDLPF